MIIINDDYMYVNDIIIFVNTGKLPESLAQIGKVIGLDELRVVSIQLLSWLKYQSNFHMKIKKQPLKVNNDYKWCSDLKKWLSDDEKLARIFVSNDTEFNFNDNIKKDAKELILDLVNKEYNPVLRRK